MLEASPPYISQGQGWAQIVLQHHGDRPVSRHSYKLGDGLWSFLASLAQKELGRLDCIKDKVLVGVDVNERESQFSYVDRASK